MTDEQMASDCVMEAQAALDGLQSAFKALGRLYHDFGADLDKYALFSDHGKPVPAQFRADACRHLEQMRQRVSAALATCEKVQAQLYQAQTLLPYGIQAQADAVVERTNGR